MNALVFQHRYHKLNRDVFTTIRGAGRAREYHAGETVPCLTPDGEFQAEVLEIHVAPIQALPLPLLKEDAEFPGCTITERGQFVNLINSLRNPLHSRARLDSLACVISLRRLPNPAAPPP